MAYTPYNPYINPYQYPAVNQQMQSQQVGTMPSPPQQQNNQGLIWVSGEIGAKSYLMAPNSTVMLMDSESSRFYIKTTDNAGMPTLRAYEYKECVQNIPQNQSIEQKDLNEQFVTREEYSDLLRKYEEIEMKLKQENQNLNRNSNKNKKVEVNENE